MRYTHTMEDEKQIAALATAMVAAGWKLDEILTGLRQIWAFAMEPPIPAHLKHQKPDPQPDAIVVD